MQLPANRATWLLLCGMMFLSSCRPAPARSPTPVPAARAETTPQPTANYLEDVSAEKGLNFERDVGQVGTYFMPESNGSGGALLDYDNDGDLDIYLIQSGPDPNAAHPSPDARRPISRLFRQEPDGRFADVTESSGLMNDGYGFGVVAGDIDNDGDLDVYLTNFGSNRVFRNNGDGTFADITQIAGIENPRWGTSVCMLDYDRDGWLDIFVVNYVDYDPSVNCPSSTDGAPEYCAPTNFAATASRLFHNNGPGQANAGGDVTFSDVTLESGIGRALGNGLGVVSADFTADQWPDVFVANDQSPNFLWVNQKNGTFVDEALLRGCAYNAVGMAAANMGIAFGDVDGDRDLDLFSTQLNNESNSLYLDHGDGHYQDVIGRTGLGAPALPYTGWGTAFVDLDHDGGLDLVIVNGRVHRAAVVAGADQDAFWNPYLENNLLFMNKGGTRFAESGRLGGDFTNRPNLGRGLAIGDIDADGDIDLLVTNGIGPAKLYRNEFPKSGHWLLVRAVDPRWKRDAIGAELTVEAGGRSFFQVVHAGSSYLSCHDPRCHFGVGSADAISQITVRWPDGLLETFPGCPVDLGLKLERGAGSTPKAQETADAGGNP